MSQSREPLALDLAPSAARSTTIPRTQRVIGVDVARGAALLGMIAAHAFPVFNSDGAPTVATVVAGGRAAATFVLVAGIGLALISGGRTVVRGRERTAVAAGLAARAVLIGALGLSLGLLSQVNDVEGILPFYGLLFLLAIPLLGLAPLVLAGVAASVIALGPVLLVATADAGLPYAGFEGDPTPATLVHDPLGLLVQLSVTGAYPLVVYLAYLCGGLAIGRLDLHSRCVAWWLLGAGAAVALTARAVSTVVLYPLGGLAQLISQNGPGNGPANPAQALLWEPQLSTSWWYLALPAPHSHSVVDMTHTLGSAMAVLGAALLLTRIPALARLLRPLAVAGTMALTLYTAHLLVLATGILKDRPVLLYLMMVIGALALAQLWQRRFGQGPLERIVTVAAGQTRRITANLLATRLSTTATPNADRRPVLRDMIRGMSQLLRPLAIAAALALVFWAGAHTAAAPEQSEPAVSAEPSPTAEPDPTPPPALLPPRAGVVSPPAPAEPAADPDRYCELSEQVHALHTLYPDQPKMIVEKARPQLNEMTQVAPVEIRDAVTTEVTDIQAEADPPEVAGPDDATLQRAETTIDAFEEKNC